MAFPLPFLAGIAIGSLAVVAFNKRDKICEKLEICENFDKAKDFCASSYDKTKNFLNEKLKNDEKSDSQAEKYDKDAKQKDEVKEEKTIKKELKKKRSSGTQKKEVE